MKSILITGGSGLVGFALQKISNNYNYTFVFLTSRECDLTNYGQTEALFKKIKPDYVIHLAACVGGLFKNMANKVEMLEKNVLINYNVLKCCHIFQVQKCISCLSTCIFPDKVEYPINETMLHLGPPHQSNSTYAYAKRLLEIHSEAYRDQYNDNFICIIPTNIYGPHDNFSLEDGHVIPALIHKCYLAKKHNIPFVIKGTGTPLRQFIYSKDLAELILWTLETYNTDENLILASSEEVSIKDIAENIGALFNYTNIEFDESFSDGQYKKTVDNTKLIKVHGPYNFTSITDGLKLSIEWFSEHYTTARK